MPLLPAARRQAVLTRLVELNAEHYGGWSFAPLSALVAEYGITARKLHGVMTVQAADAAAALARRDAGDAGGEGSGMRGVLPIRSPVQS